MIVSEKVVRWLRTGSWALLDQASFTLANFVLNIFLARWLLQEEYGGFAIAYSTFLLVGTLHTGFVTGPMLVFGSGKYIQQFSCYLRSVLSLSWALSGCGGLMILLAAIVIRYAGLGDLATSMMALASVTPLMLFHWTSRRACYATLTPRVAALAGILYFALVVSSVALLNYVRWLSAVNALLVMGLSSTLSGWLIWINLRGTKKTETAISMAEIIPDHWKYGRWAAPTGLVSWFAGNIYYFVLPRWGGLQATAILRAAMNLIQPLFQALLPLTFLNTGVFVRQRSAGSMGGTVRTMTVLLLGGALAYIVIIGIYHPVILEWLYSGRYAIENAVIWPLLALALVGSLVAVVAPALRALERPDWVFWGYCGSATAAVTIGLGVTALYGVAGAAIGLVIGSAISVAIMGFALTKHAKNKSKPSGR